MDIVDELEGRFLPLLREVKDRLEIEYPTYTFRVWSSPVGGMAHRGHDIGLECEFPDAGKKEATSVSVSIGVTHLHAHPKLCQATVDWGCGEHPAVTANLLNVPCPYTQEALNEIVRQWAAKEHIESHTW
jgi:hypothetical protein